MNSESEGSLYSTPLLIRKHLQVYFSPRIRVSFEKLIVAQLARKFLQFMNTKFQFSQHPANGPYLKPDESSPQTPTVFPWNTF
jgi:hypothetical protein